jgi:hypothetical protein
MATAIAPWLPGPWASGRFFALCIAPGAAVLLLFCPRVFRNTVRAAAAVLLASAVCAPASFYLLLRLLGNPSGALVAFSLMWGVLLGSAYLWRSRLPAEDPEGGWRSLLLIGGASLFVALPLLLNAELRLRSDAWTHIALVRKILENPYPWTDPRFAGQQLRYFWFFNLWAAGFATRAGTSIPWGLTLTNLAGLLAYVSAVLAVIQRLYSRGALRIAAAAVAFAGLNPLGFYGITTHLIRPLIGAQQEPEALPAILRELQFLHSDVIYTLTPYLTSFVAWIDKFEVITAFGIGMAGAVFLSLIIWKAVQDGRIGAQAALLTAITFAAVVFHHLVAAVYLGTALGAALLLARLCRRSSLSWRATLLLLGMMALAAVASLPYYAGILLGREATESGFGIAVQQLWVLTAFTSIGPFLILLLIGRRRLQETLGRAGSVFLIFAAVSLAMILLVSMPSVNENKMIILFFCVAAPLGAHGALALHNRAWHNIGTRALWMALVVAAFLVPGLIWFGHLVHPATVVPGGVADACAWIRNETPRDAILIEPVGRRFLMNRGERDMFVSDHTFVLECGYPREAMERRIALVEHLYKSGMITAEQAGLLEDLGRPVYTFWQRGSGDRSGDGMRLHAGALLSSPYFEPVFRNPDAEIYRMRRIESISSESSLRSVPEQGSSLSGR